MMRGLLKRRIVRWALAGLAILVVALGLTIAFLPALLSSSFAKDRILAFVRSRLGAEVDAESLRFSWGGKQEVKDLRIAPPGAPAGGDDLFRAESIVLETGLLELLRSSEGAITIVVVRPELRVLRDAEGRFSFDPLLGGGGTEEKGEPAGEAPERGRAERGPSRPIRLVIEEGKASYRDEKLEVASTIEDLEAEVEVRASEARLAASGSVRQEGVAPGSFQVHASAEGLEGGAGLRGGGVAPSLSAVAEVRSIDLRPYRALLERLAGVSAPERPVTGQIRVESAERGLELAGDLDAGFGRLDAFRCVVPRKSLGGEAEIVVPLSLDLPATLAFLRPRASVPEGAEVGGTVSGTLHLAAPITFEDLAARDVPGFPFALRLDASADDLSVLWPRSSRDERGTEAGAAPIRIHERRLSLAVRVSSSGDADGFRLESAKLEGEGFVADIAGSFAPGGPAAAAPPRRVDLRGSLQLAIPQLVSLAGVALSPRLEISPDAVVRLENLSLRGEGGGDRGGSERWRGAGRLEVRGPIRYGGVSSSGLVSELRVEGRRVELPGLVLSLNGGEVRADDFTLDLDGGPQYRVSLEADGIAAHVDMAPLLAYVVPFVSAVEREAELSGTIRGSLKLSGAGFGPDELRKGLTGEGSIRIAEGSLAAAPFLKELAGILRTDLDSVLFEEIGSDFGVGGGRVVAGRVFLQGREGSKVRAIDLEGATSFDGALDYGMKLSSLRESIGDKQVRRVLEYAEKYLGGDLLPLRLRGTIAEPKLSLEAGSGGLNLGGLLEGIDLEGILEGRRPPPEDAPRGKPPAGEAPPEDSAEAIERGVRDILEILRRREK